MNYGGSDIDPNAYDVTRRAGTRAGDNVVTISSGVGDTSPCYCAGTRILTERGEVAVEDLAVGEWVVTASGDSRRIVWIGRRGIEVALHASPSHILPVCVRAGAFGRGRPHRDLWLSPEHAVVVDGAPVPIEQLVNGANVAQVAVERVIYFHVELESHDVLLAEGLPAESYLDRNNRRAFDNADEGETPPLPDFRAPLAPGTVWSPIIVALRAELAQRAARMGLAAELAAHEAAQRARARVPRTNFVRNPRAEGAAAGKLGADGCAPTIWSLGAPDGVEIDIMGVGREDELHYIDLRFAGSSVEGGKCIVYPEPGVEIYAGFGQFWTASVYVRLIGGGFDGVEDLFIYFDETGVDGSYLTGEAYRQPRPTESEPAPLRISVTRRLERPDVVATTAYLLIPVTPGAAVDLTLRIAGPQIEQGDYASDLILPPPGEYRASSRAAAEAEGPRTVQGAET